MACDLAERPPLDKVEAMNGVDLVRRKHRQFVYTGKTALIPDGCSLQDGGWLGWGVNSLENQDLRESYVVLYKIADAPPPIPLALLVACARRPRDAFASRPSDI